MRVLEVPVLNLKARKYINSKADGKATWTCDIVLKVCELGTRLAKLHICHFCLTAGHARKDFDP